MSGPRILLVGAGAVGQAYGFHLQEGGADLSFFVKAKYAEAARAGFSVRCHNGRHRGSHHFSGFGVITTPAQVAARTWDQVWLCVSSTALRGVWLEPLLDAVGEAAVVTLQPGLEDRARLLERVPESRLVSGMITLISYPTPLPGEVLDPGMAWWFPPASPSPFSGAPGAVSSVVRALARGGCPAKAAADVHRTVAFGGALMMPVIAALEVAGWSLRALVRGPTRRLATDGGRQASAIARPGERRWLAWLVSHGVTLRLLALFAPRFVPFDLEVYLRVHFTKVGDQTRAMLRLYCERGRNAGRPHDALASLLERLD
jgi:hypothetical protein